MFEKTYDISVWFGCNVFVVLFLFGFVVIITKHRERKNTAWKRVLLVMRIIKAITLLYRVCDTLSEIIFKYSSISKQLFMHDVPICSQFIWLLHKVLIFFSSFIYPLSFYCLETWFESKTKCTNIHHIQNRRTQNTTHMHSTVLQTFAIKKKYKTKIKSL